MREPAFWHRPASWQSRLLFPIGTLYGAITARRMGLSGTRVDIPVICVGNYHVGGAGKTPTVLALVDVLRALGEKPCVVSRGYGGRLHGPVEVDAQCHGAADVGDEPLMMAAKVAVVVARDRVAGARLAQAKGASVVLLDDGFQNPFLAKDASLIVVDSHRALGNGRVFPAGPLRAPLAQQVARTDALVVVGDGNAANAVATVIATRGKPVLRARLVPNEHVRSALQGQRVFAFAGIGDPDRFFGTLRASGIDVVREAVFPDHHPFRPREIAALVSDAARDGLTLVTTEKDIVRLRSDPALASYANGIVAFGVTLKISDDDALRGLVEGILGKGAFSGKSSDRV
jgi:tetraacyldisaccharide 4'-kinase